MSNILVSDPLVTNNLAPRHIGELILVFNNKHTSNDKKLGNNTKVSFTTENLLLDVIMSLRLYSILSFGTHKHRAPHLSRIALVLPLAGLIIGIIPTGVLLISFFMGMQPLLSAILAIAVWILITGAMAEDAIADTFDGLFGGQTIAQRLKIFRDHHHGTYGVTALFLYLLLRIFALAEIASSSIFAAASVWLGATILSRSGSLWLALRLPPARQDGISASSDKLSIWAFIIGLVFAIFLTLGLVAPFTGIEGLLVAIILVCIIAEGWTRLCLKMVGGQTGDLIGALQVLLEIAALSVFIINVGP